MLKSDLLKKMAKVSETMEGIQKANNRLVGVSDKNSRVWVAIKDKYDDDELSLCLDFDKKETEKVLEVFMKLEQEKWDKLNKEYEEFGIVPKIEGWDL